MVLKNDASFSEAARHKDTAECLNFEIQSKDVENTIQSTITVLRNGVCRSNSKFLSQSLDTHRMSRGFLPCDNHLFQHM